MTGHHISIRTGNIHRAIAFYQCLGFAMETQFTAGITLACWMKGSAGRLELIQIPAPKPAPDAFGDEHYVGYYHLALDVSEMLDSGRSLQDWLNQFQQVLAAQDLSTQVLLPPQTQTIGDQTYEVAFITDIDQLPIELLNPVTSVD